MRSEDEIDKRELRCSFGGWGAFLEGLSFYLEAGQQKPGRLLAFPSPIHVEFGEVERNYCGICVRTSLSFPPTAAVPARLSF